MEKFRNKKKEKRVKLFTRVLIGDVDTYHKGDC